MSADAEVPGEGVGAAAVAERSPAQGGAGASRGLRVLMVMHIPASMELGAARVQLELAEVLREAGCEVAVLDLDEIVPPRPGRLRRGRLGVSSHAFAAAAVRRVSAIAGDFDIVEAHQGNLPVSKERLGLDGLLVTRSAGLAPMYASFVRYSQGRWPAHTNPRLLSRPVRRWRKRRSLRHVTATFELCDLINVPNRDEAGYLADHHGLGEKTVVIPNGISEQRLADLGELVGKPTQARVAFIGDWSARKGSLDWPAVAAHVLRRVPDVSFALLGTRVGAAEVASSMGIAKGRLEVVPSYPSEQLGELLRGVRVGALPSYVEGFGLGVLEKMAAGIPSVCYDVPGPRETIGRVEPRLLVPAGDTHAFAERLVELLTADEQSYRLLSQRCRSTAERFSWRLVGRDTLSAYRQRLGMLERSARAPARSAAAGG